ncbi:RNA methyltransferase [Synechococcus elongatus]|uniref:tRNA (cytidine/uridine-2'-O-)-methyltransferase TrmJ n=2 Tax=Synechococcus elongatus TaxID=32046 RepID=Q31MT7_SYNE7|nr:RNA methyltransferase [Synechococcus elongatus]ABB57632.1 RNA methyltransferase TrmH, group 1 [Synechococcus elongatus PCC 7942 = FACHB-805]AJD57973.1 RNA methyltransferase [Synechococcus elongatus UTEX 2973]MBD2588440.1 RNA methyltransferase [Synechococcus elongatus FACHB-242]MBD2689397.1 RNA methyltransferase [Synechococcus elongatus FACHB-1061]MBD2708184.1 RNA methyltransferase [Synechococcus elongatus PCC 7942 = FACHB-805]
MSLRIVLVEPAGARNVGAIARVMMNFGLSDWAIVRPRCDIHGGEARQMAVHAAALLEQAVLVDNLPSALEGCQWVAATTGQRDLRDLPLESPTQILPWLRQGPAALIFGREDSGLQRSELSLAQRYLTFPTDPAYPSLNLAQAVGLCCYHYACLSEADSRGVPQQESSPAAVRAAFEQLHGYTSDLEALLLRVGYLHSHTAASRMEKIRAIAQRSALTAEEVALLRGMVRQLNWALNQVPSSDRP